jgi:hypothetical protein
MCIEFSLDTTLRCTDNLHARGGRHAATHSPQGAGLREEHSYQARLSAPVWIGTSEVPVITEANLSSLEATFPHSAPLSLFRKILELSGVVSIEQMEPRLLRFTIRRSAQSDGDAQTLQEVHNLYAKYLADIGREGCPSKRANCTA